MKIIFEKKKKGLWANIHAKRERGESPAKPGDKDYPDKKQWDKLTKEELEQVVSEEIEKIFEAEMEDTEVAAQKAVNDATKMKDTANKDVIGATNNLNVAQGRDPKLAQVAKKELEAKRLNKKYADDNLKAAKKAASEAETVKEEKSNFQKEMEKKGKGWKVRLLTKGKQSAGSAYPNSAPVERAKSAPPGAGGV